MKNRYIIIIVVVTIITVIIVGGGVTALVIYERKKKPEDGGGSGGGDGGGSGEGDGGGSGGGDGGGDGGSGGSVTDCVLFSPADSQTQYTLIEEVKDGLHIQELSFSETFSINGVSSGKCAYLDFAEIGGSRTYSDCRKDLSTRVGATQNTPPFTYLFDQNLGFNSGLSMSISIDMFLIFYELPSYSSVNITPAIVVTDLDNSENAIIVPSSSDGFQILSYPITIRKLSMHRILSFGANTNYSFFGKKARLIFASNAYSNFKAYVRITGTKVGAKLLNGNS
jgi:hypothetical protein